MSDLQGLQNRIASVNRAHGFREDGDAARQDSNPAHLRTYYSEKLMLIVSEASEALDELRTGHAMNETYYPTRVGFLVAKQGDERYKPGGKVLVQEVPEGPHKPEGVPSELADIVIRVFDLADESGIDLGAMIEEKIAYNETRPYKHGKVM